jgi:hypothetical protein
LWRIGFGLIFGAFNVLPAYPAVTGGAVVGLARE